MKGIELDLWFFALASVRQEEITGIKRVDYGITDEIDGTCACDYLYEEFDEDVAYWWDSHDYEQKLAIYLKEEFGTIIE